jgi:PII-like signaling protein
MPDSLEGEQALVSIHIPEDEDARGQSIGDKLLEQLRRAGVANATLVPIRASFGKSSLLRAPSGDLRVQSSLLVQVVEREADVPKLMAVAKDLLPEGMVYMPRRGMC